MLRSVISAVVVSLVLVSGAMSAEFSADMMVTSMGRTSSGKLYVKNDHVSRTEMMGTISISKRPMVYQLFADTKKYVVTDLDAMKQKNLLADMKNFEDWLKKNNFRKVGSETVSGYRCDVFEGEVALAGGQDPVPMKIWYTPKLGYPVRQESNIPPPVGNIVTSLENIQVGQQADSLFEIPSDYTEAKSMQEAMGMGDMPSMGQGGQGQTPSQEDMQKMMKEMMKRMEKQ
jgi:hypothetical protein